MSDDTPLPSLENSTPGLRVKIIGVGGAGANTLDRLQLDEFPAVRRAVINTDAQALAKTPVAEKIIIGRTVTRGLSAGGEASLGLQAAEADRALIERAVADTELVFLVAGLGGGTGSGAAPVVAETAAKRGAMVIAFVTMPFSMEGGRRAEQAQAALVRLRLNCEAVIPIYNDLLMQAIDDTATVLDAFSQADAWIGRGIGSLCAMLFKTGLINIDFAALRGAFPVRDGKTLFTLGRGQGKDGAYQALEELLNSPLLQRRETLRHATTLVVNILSGPGLTLPKVNEIVSKIAEKFGGRENTVLGAIIDDTYGDAVEICVIGSTGGIRPRPATRLVEADPVETIPEEETTAPVSPVRTSPARKTIDEAAATLPGRPGPAGKKADQVEINFVEEETRRNFFESTKNTVIDGQDVDIPTYIRRGIKIAL